MEMKGSIIISTTTRTTIGVTEEEAAIRAMGAEREHLIPSQIILEGLIVIEEAITAEIINTTEKLSNIIQESQETVHKETERAERRDFRTRGEKIIRESKEETKEKIKVANIKAI